MGRVQFVEMLLNVKGVEVNKTIKEQYFALGTACGQGHVEVAKLLLASDEIEVNKALKDGTTALHYTLGHKTKELLESGRSRFKVVELLLAAPGIDVNKRTTKHNSTPLVVGCTAGHVASVKVLLPKKGVMLIWRVVDLVVLSSLLAREDTPKS
ncbi:hypothetical protein TrLO_g12790 [Triparma laevis f. longispina]|uniref:Uncharacterized protein n=1 Tax=Triparma laevis f. longispina TaxID=1714387 RepID=A0A9W7DTU7_9STRA|nr:hypothetical protein TrLO_g12790 [Triparma laevis f. longispina]